MPSARIPQHANDFNQDDLMAAFLALKGNIFRNLHVATLCTVENIEDPTFRIVRCTAFPRRQGKPATMMNAICIDQADYDKITAAFAQHGKPLALIVLTDYDSEANYKYIKQNDKIDQTETVNTTHSYNNAIIIKVGDTIGAVEMSDAERE